MKRMTPEYDMQEESTVQEINRQKQNILLKKMPNHSEKIQIQGLYVDINMNYWFNVISNGKKETISREQLI